MKFEIGKRYRHSKKYIDYFLKKFGPVFGERTLQCLITDEEVWDGETVELNLFAFVACFKKKVNNNYIFTVWEDFNPDVKYVVNYNSYLVDEEYPYFLVLDEQEDLPITNPFTGRKSWL